MPDRCVVYGCSNENSKVKGISLHRIPYWQDENPAACRRRKLWVNFIRTKRANFQPSKYSSVCSVHFKPEDFERQNFAIQGFTSNLKRSLVRDDLGVSAVPSIFATSMEVETGETDGDQDGPSTSAPAKGGKSAANKGVKRPRTSRQHRMFIRNAMKETHKEQEEDFDGDDEDDDTQDEDYIENDSQIYLAQDENSTKMEDFASQTPGCLNCKWLLSRHRRTRNMWIAKKSEVLKLKEEIKAKNEILSKLEWSEMQADLNASFANVESPVDEAESMDNISESEDYFDIEEETELQAVGSDDDISEEKSDHKKEPKFIVFLSQLLLLFRFCSLCKSDDPKITMRRVGTMIEVKTVCQNEDCIRNENKWQSQPLFPGTKIPAANLLLSFAILVGGSSATKVSHIFNHMGLACISLSTFFKHQKEKLFPAVYQYWINTQNRMISSLTESGEQLVVSGDGRHDSMGHSAKFGAYSLFCCNTSQIIHFSLVQRNEIGSSTAMEFEGFKRSLQFLENNGLNVTTFISDRHLSIAKYFREERKDVLHYFDLWHLKKKIRKILLSISNTKDCGDLSEWIKACERHLYWSATSTPDGNGDIIWAKFVSFLWHILDEHTGFEDPLFDHCAHGEDIEERKWLEKDYVPDIYETLVDAIAANNLNATVEHLNKLAPCPMSSAIEKEDRFAAIEKHFARKSAVTVPVPPSTSVCLYEELNSTFCIDPKSSESVEAAYFV
eukprot:gene11457-21665_t